MSGLQAALLGSQSKEAAPSLCRRVSALAALRPAPMTDLKYRGVCPKVRSLLTRVFACRRKDT